MVTKAGSRLVKDMLDCITNEAIGDACKRWVEQNTSPPDYCFYRFLGYLGGRRYNRFLDYGLLLLKLSEYFKSIMWNGGIPKEYTKTIGNLYHYLMFDDRHDLWQNLPYSLDKMIPGVNFHDNETRDMKVYLRLCEILIMCINEHGTGDTTFSQGGTDE